MKFVRELKCDSAELHDVKNCRTFPIAKMHRLPFSNKGTRASVVFELIHVDICTLISYLIHSHDNKMYFVTLVDDYSKTTWFYLMQHKSDVVVVIKMFFSLVEN